MSAYCRLIDPAAPTLLCADPQDPTFGNNENRQIPRFLGPDGRANTGDDLPISRGPDPFHPVFLTQDDQTRLLLLKRFPAFGSFTQDLIPSLPVGPGDVVELIAAGSDGQLGTPDDVCHGVGFNADGACIFLMANSGAVIDPGSLPALGDPSLRPSSAVLEPADLTDLVARSGGVTLPARPPSPNGALGFPGGVANGSYSRRIDPSTGAPVRAAGPLSCAIRRAGGVAVGPNGVAGDGDDSIPSDGNCLLFDPPASAQQVRSREAIARDHPAHQSLFHTFCTLLFDEDGGHCGVDVMNAPSTWPAVLEALANRTSEGISGAAVLGREYLRSSTTRSAGVGTVVTLQIFSTINITSGDPSKKVGDLDARILALLGCGEAYGTGCDLTGAERFRNDAAIRQAFPSPGDATPPGGIDWMNASAGPLFQELTQLKAMHAGELVGPSDGGGFDPGIIRPVGLTQEQARALGVTAHQTAGAAIAAAGEFALAEGASGVVPLSSMLRRPNAPADNVPTDFVIERPRWIPDRDWLALGVLVFRDPRGPDQTLGTGDDVVDPLGENCTALYGGPDPGCTDFEVLSANLERLFITNALVGRARYPDPPETFAELMAILDGDPNNDDSGDPISGQDGIVFNDYDSDGDGIADQKAIDIRSIEEPFVSGQFQLVNSASKCVRQEAFVSAKSICYRRLVRRSDGLRIGALPVGVPVQIRDDGGVWGKRTINLQAMDPLEIQRLFSVQLESGTFDFSENGVITPTDRGIFVEVDTDSDGTREEVAVSEAILITVLSADFDANLVNDLDEDRDGIPDLVDDGHFGPVTVSSVACGSGIPGDALQDALQTEYVNSADQLLERAHFGPQGLPPRSPVFCPDLVAMIGLTGVKESGRRDFIWHGGPTPSDLDGDGLTEERDPCILGSDCAELPVGLALARVASSDDADGDGVHAELDTCPTLANPSQLDSDADGVGDACDSCTLVPNPPPAPDPSRTTTGGQLDDDADGYGNACDADFDQLHAKVDSADMGLFQAAFGQWLEGTCGPARSCAAYDLDGAHAKVDSADLAIFKALFNRQPGPRCRGCGVDLQTLPCVGPSCP